MSSWSENGATTLSIVCPTLIQREAELVAAEQCLAMAATGQMRLLLLAGEAGIGKSRLTASITQYAVDRGFRTLRASCLEYDRTLPFAPVADLLRNVLGSQPPEALSRALGPATTTIRSLLPELGMAGVALNDIEKPVLFRTLTTLLSPAFAPSVQPTLIIIEDLHWADAVTLEFLPFFVQRVRDLPLLLVFSYRSDEVGPDLARMLAILGRLRPAVVDMALAPLDELGVRQMIAAIFGQQRAIRDEFVRVLDDLADGNPFFIEELLRTLVDAGDIYLDRGVWTRKPIGQLHIPHSIAEAVRARTISLDPVARRVLQLAAILGRQFEFEVLRELSQLDETTLLAILKRLIALQILAEEDAEQFAFRHALAREAVAAELLARERRGLHRVVAELLEHRPLARPGVLAYHCYEAGWWDRAAEYSRHAGEQAMALFAAGAADEHFSRAIDACERQGITPSASLWYARGQAREHLGRLPLAAADYEQAVARAHTAGDTAGEWQALLALGFLWTGQEYARAGEYFHRALMLARTANDPPLLVQTLNRLGNWHLMTAHPEQSLPLHDEALAIVQASGDPQGLAVTCDLLGIAHSMHGDLTAGARYYEQALRHWRALGEQQWHIPTLASYATRGGNALFATAVCMPLNLAQALAETDEALRQARSIGWLNGEATALIWQAALLAPRGESELALAATHTAREISTEHQHQLWLLTVDAIDGTIYLNLFAFDQAEQILRQALERGYATGSSFVILSMSAYLALALLGQGRIAEAEAALDAVSGPQLPLYSQAQQQVWYARARLALVRGDAASALALAEQLQYALVAPWRPDPTSTARLAPRLWQLHGDALAASGDLAQAEQAYSAAATAAGWLDMRPLQWQSFAALSRLYRRKRRVDAEQAATAAARALLDEIATRTPDAFRAAMLVHAERSLPSARQPNARAVERGRYGGLTAREREVAALVAQGKTSRAIAAELILSDRTVEKHIANVMAKLGVESRAQIAVWAAEHGLATSS